MVQPVTSRSWVLSRTINLQRVIYKHVTHSLTYLYKTFPLLYSFTSYRVLGFSINSLSSQSSVCARPFTVLHLDAPRLWLPLNPRDDVSIGTLDTCHPTVTPKNFVHLRCTRVDTKSLWVDLRHPPSFISRTPRVTDIWPDDHRTTPSVPTPFLLGQKLCTQSSKS